MFWHPQQGYSHQENFKGLIKGWPNLLSIEPLKTATIKWYKFPKCWEILVWVRMVRFHYWLSHFSDTSELNSSPRGTPRVLPRLMNTPKTQRLYNPELSKSTWHHKENTTSDTICWIKPGLSEKYHTVQLSGNVHGAYMKLKQTPYSDLSPTQTILHSACADRAKSRRKKSKRKHLGSGLLNLNVSCPKAFFGVHSCDKGLSVSQWQELSLSHKWLIKVRYSAKLKPSQPYLPTLKAGVLNVLALRTAWGMSILWSMTQKLNPSQVFFFLLTLIE